MGYITALCQLTIINAFGIGWAGLQVKCILCFRVYRTRHYTSTRPLRVHIIPNL